MKITKDNCKIIVFFFLSDDDKLTKEVYDFRPDTDSGPEPGMEIYEL